MDRNVTPIDIGLRFNVGITNRFNGWVGADTPVADRWYRGDKYR